MRTLGLVGGLSWESTAIYYRLLNEMVRERVGGLTSAKLVLWSFDFARIEAMQAAGDWAGATAAMEDAARALVAAGAEAIVIASNTMHRMADAVERAAGVPLVHIADATGAAVVAAGVRAPLLLATRYTMEQAFYRGRLGDRFDLDVRVPGDADRALVHAVIYDELCRGIVRAESRADYVAVVERAVAAGADGVVFGCTEVGMLLSQGDVPVPAFDTTVLHAAAAIDFALGVAAVPSQGSSGGGARSM